MASLHINIDHIYDNIDKINKIMHKYDKQWSLVVKVLGGNDDILRKVIQYPVVEQIHSVSSSRWQELRFVKSCNNKIRTILIRPSLGSQANEIVFASDITLDTALTSIQALDLSAQKIHKKHSIIVMIEMGDLREGIKREGLIPFYNSVYNLTNIEIIGIGANLGCMFGDLPSYDKLLQLVIYSQLLEAHFNSVIDIVSGGTSITLPLLDSGEVPNGINHFRIGEAVFLGTSPYNEKQYADLHTDCFIFEANILELYRKESFPEKRSKALLKTRENNNYHQELESYKALVDFGIIDVSPDYLIPMDDSIDFFGNSSDLSVYDLGENINSYKTGGNLKFNVNYLGLAQLMNSKYIEKKID